MVKYLVWTYFLVRIYLEAKVNLRILAYQVTEVGTMLQTMMSLYSLLIMDRYGESIFKCDSSFFLGNCC